MATPDPVNLGVRSASPPADHLGWRSARAHQRRQLKRPERWLPPPSGRRLFRRLSWSSDSPSGLYWRPIGVSAARVPGEAQSSGTPRRRRCLAWRLRSAGPSRLLGGLGTAQCDPEVGGDCVCQGKHVAGPCGPTARSTVAAILRIRPVAPDDPEGGRREDLLVCLVDVVHFSLHGRAPERDLTCRCKRVPPGGSPKGAKSHLCE